LEVARREHRLQELPRLLVCVGVVSDGANKRCVFVADDNVFNVANDELVVMPLLTSRHGLKEQAFNVASDELVVMPLLTSRHGLKEQAFNVASDELVVIPLLINQHGLKE
jgi:hypothetical protein